LIPRAAAFWDRQRNGRFFLGVSESLVLCKAVDQQGPARMPLASGRGHSSTVAAKSICRPLFVGGRVQTWLERTGAKSLWDDRQGCCGQWPAGVLRPANQAFANECDCMAHLAPSVHCSQSSAQWAGARWDEQLRRSSISRHDCCGGAAMCSTLLRSLNHT
jgi:hypothetical protein